MPKAIKVVLNGKTYDYDKLEDVAQLQSILLPPDWPIAKRDGVRLFLNLREMLTHEFQRHFAANFKKVVRSALEQKDDGEDPIVALAFGFDVNLSALTLASIGKTKFGGSQKFSTTGSAKSHDINQGDFLADLSETLDTAKLEAEGAPPVEEKKDKPKKSSKKTAKAEDAAS